MGHWRFARQFEKTEKSKRAFLHIFKHSDFSSFVHLSLKRIPLCFVSFYCCRFAQHAIWFVFSNISLLLPIFVCVPNISECGFNSLSVTHFPFMCDFQTHNHFKSSHLILVYQFEYRMYVLLYRLFNRMLGKQTKPTKYYNATFKFL